MKESDSYGFSLVITEIYIKSKRLLFNLVLSIKKHLERCLIYLKIKFEFKHLKSQALLLSLPLVQHWQWLKVFHESYDQVLEPIEGFPLNGE